MPFDGVGFKIEPEVAPEIKIDPVLLILMEVKRLIRRGFATGCEVSHRPWGRGYCVLGALKKASNSPKGLWTCDLNWTPEGIRARNFVCRAADVLLDDLWDWNDGGIPFLQKYFVLRAVDRAINLCAAEGA